MPTPPSTVATDALAASPDRIELLLLLAQQESLLVPVQGGWLLTFPGGAKTKGSREADNIESLFASGERAEGAFQKMPAHPSRPPSRQMLRLTAHERTQLHTWVASRTVPHRLVVRSRIVLLASRGLAVTTIAAQLHVTPATVRLWCRRFTQGGVAALERDARGRGRPRGMTRAHVLAVLRAMRQLPPARRSARGVAARAHVSPSTVWRVWKRQGLSGTSSPVEIERAIETLISETARAPE